MIYSTVCSMKHTHVTGCEDLRSQGHKDIVQDRMEGNGFLIREFPVRPLNKGQYVMDYDMPELVVFLYEDHQQFVKDICIDRGDSTKGKCHRDRELDRDTPCLFDFNMKCNSNSNVGTMETASSNSSGSEFAPQHLCTKDVMKTFDFRNLMMEGEVELGSGDENSIDQPTKKRTSEALGQVFRKEEDYSRSFSFKHWQINSFVGTIGSMVEFPHCAEYQQFPKSTSVSRPQMGNSQSLTGSGKSFDLQTDYPEENSCAVGPLCRPTSDTVLARKSDRASDQSNDITSSATSFSFPILTPEWMGSPVKMAEADRGQSRKHQWRKICFPCCKF